MTIYEKIAKIQDEVEVRKEADNPFFHSKYATYEGVLNCIHSAMRKYELVAVHGFGKPSFDGQICVTTTIFDASSQEKLEAELHIPSKANDPQAAGSAITYAKRYSLLAMLGLGTEDDDANSSSNPMKKAAEEGTYNPQSEDVAERAVCPIHKVPLKHFEKNGKEWWSHQTQEGWCNGRITNYNKSQNT